MPTPSLAPARERVPRVAVVLAAAALVLAGCVAPKQQTTVPEAGAPVSSAAPGDTAEAYYEQDVAWEDCGAYECATVLAPLDWDDPAAGPIELAVQRSRATGAQSERVGSLLINPGGPGASGIEFLDYAVTTSFSDRLLRAYDVVGFDPRGVGSSTAVDCGDDALVDEVLTADLPRDEAEFEAASDAARRLGEACLEGTGPLLGEIDTVSAARDMDLLRAVLGDEQLHYAGFSYGTFLGATYAELFPERVGRLLLDGALDPSVTTEELIVGQAAGFEASLRAYVEDCQAGASCPLRGDVEDGLAQIAQLTERLEAGPIPAGETAELNGSLAFYGIALTLYDERYWSMLTSGLSEVISEGTGATLLQLGNAYLSRTGDGTYTSNSMMAFRAINCVDYPAQEYTFEELTALQEEVAKTAPTFARDFVMEPGCETWPVPATGTRGPITAEGAAPILVVGTTGDPATPYEWSVALADQLESGVLVTYDGEGHTAYGRSNECVTTAVDDYLVDGTVPQEGLVC